MKELLVILFGVLSYQSTKSAKPLNLIISGPISNNPQMPASLGISLESVTGEDGHIRKKSLPKAFRSIRKYKQTWRGVEVWGFGATYRENPDELLSAKLVQGIDIDQDVQSNNPKITIDRAIRLAFKNRTVKSRNIKTLFQPDHDDGSHFKLMVYIDPMTTKARLVYRMEFLMARMSDVTELTNVFITMDANTAEIITAYEKLVTFQMTGDGGNIKIGKIKYGEGKYANKWLKVTKKGKKCKSFNPSTFVSNGKKILFFPTDLCFETQGPHKETCNPVSPNDDATDTSYSQVHDALFYATTFTEMLQTLFGDTTLKECCGQLRLCVQYNHSDFSFYLNSSNCETYYGFGGKKMLDLASSTIIGHELGHALIACTSKLEYKCHPGAIAESFADLCGLMLKAYLNDFETDWRIGSEIIRVRNLASTAVRFMDHPPADGHSIDCTSDYKCDEVHYDNGIYNKAIFNLASTEGWNIIKVFQIFLRANKFYWKALTSFSEGVCELMHAAKDFGYDEEDVANAFAEVGVFCECPDGWVMREYGMDDFGHNITSCFKFVNQNASWAEATAYCESMHSKLAVLDTVKKAQWVDRQVPDNAEYWLAAMDLKTEGQWTWMPTETPVAWDNWHYFNTEPSRVKRNCMSLTSVKTIFGIKWGWNDENCDTEHHFICEIGCCGKSCSSH